MIEYDLIMAAKDGLANEVELLLRDHPLLYVDWAPTHRRLSALHLASESGHVEVVKLLLKFPLIHVNLKSRGGDTSFALACLFGHLSVVRVLLKDPRVDVTLGDKKWQHSTVVCV